MLCITYYMAATWFRLQLLLWIETMILSEMESRNVYHEEFLHEKVLFESFQLRERKIVGWKFLK